MCKITWFINDHKSRVTNSILTALAIQASNSQNTLPRYNFHSPRKMPPGRSPRDSFFGSQINFIFSSSFLYQLLTLLGNIFLHVHVFPNSWGVAFFSKQRYLFLSCTIFRSYALLLLLPAQLENNTINSYTCTIMIVNYYKLL